MSIETTAALIVVATLCDILLAAALSIALAVYLARLIRKQVRFGPCVIVADWGVSAGIPRPGQAIPNP